MKKEVVLLLFILVACAPLEPLNPHPIIANNPELNYDQKVFYQRIENAFQPIDCPTFKRNFNDIYDGPMIDTHVHIAPLPDNPNYDENNGRPAMSVNVKITDYTCMLDAERTTKTFAFFAVWDPITRESLDLVKRTMETYPDSFIPFIMTPDHDDRADGFPTVNAETLSEYLAVYPNLFKGYGEIGLYERSGDGGPKGAKALPPNSDRLNDIYPILKNNSLLVYFHLGEGQQDSFEAVLTANPDLNFIWHGDQLIVYENGTQNLEALDEILSNHPNAYYGVDELYGDTWLLRPEITKEEFLAHFENKEELLAKDSATWKDFIERHPDQVLWGTDRGWSAPWSIDPVVAVTLNDYSRAFIAKLDPAVQEKFAYKNAEKLVMKK